MVILNASSAAPRSMMESGNHAFTRRLRTWNRQGTSTTGSDCNSRKSMPRIITSSLASDCWSLTSVYAHQLRSDQTLRMPLRTFCGYHQKPAVAQRQRRPTGFSYSSRFRRHKRVCKFNTRQIPQNAIRRY